MRRFVFISLLAVLFLPVTLHAAEGSKAAKQGEFLGAHPVEIPAWFKRSFLALQEDVEDAAASGKRVMLYFHQNGCPYCAKLVNDNFTDKRIVDYLDKHFDSLDINMWGDREVVGLDGKDYNEKSYAANQRVWFTPSILFYDEKGKVVLRINGYYPPDKFLVALKYVKEKKENAISFTDYYAQFTKKQKPGKLHTESYFAKPAYDLQKLKQSGKPLAVLFEEADCKPCDRLHNVTLKQKDTIDVVKQFNVVQLDRWSDTPVIDLDGNKTTAKKLARKLGVAFAPYAVLYDKGKEVIRIEGFLKNFHVQSVFDYVLSGGYKKETSFQRYLEHRADEIRATGKTVDIWN